MAPRDYMVWLDLETTGLNPLEHRILELGLVVSDVNLNILATKAWVIRQGTPHIADEFVREMHTRSGLLAELGSPSSTPIMEVEREAIDWLREQGIDKGKYPMCGSSIQFDRKFTGLHLPTLDAFFHYRNIDVSTLKELLPLWFTFPPAPMPNKDHRTVSDIRHSIAELRHYRNFLLTKGYEAR